MFCFVLFLIGEYFIVPYTAHTMPTSSEWRQLCRPTPACLQLAKRLSVPPHATSSKRIAPVPPWKRTRAEVTPGKPSCLQATGRPASPISRHKRCPTDRAGKSPVDPGYASVRRQGEADLCTEKVGGTINKETNNPVDLCFGYSTLGLNTLAISNGTGNI